MCGRYGFSIKDAREVIERFELINTLDEVEKLKSRYNIAPGQLNPVIVNTSEGYKMGRFMWGLIPFWSKDDSFKFKTINARVEGIEDKPVFRKAFKSQHCLIPASFFYEWDKSVKPSNPYLFKMKDDSIFSFAGLFDKWHDKNTGKDIYSYTILTCPPNKILSKKHNRMPVILKREDEKEWLNPNITENEQMFEMLYPYDDKNMTSFVVSRNINSPLNDSEELIKKN